MYGFYGGITTIFHTIIRFPVLAVCIGIGGVAYEALICPPEPTPVISHAIVPPVVEIKPIDPPVPLVETKDISVYFDVDKSVIKPEFRDVIKQEAMFLTSHPNVIVRIEGHTDARSPDDHNMVLGTHRALAVKNALVELGVAETQISDTVSYGKRKARLPCPKEKCYKENRRVDVLSRQSK